MKERNMINRRQNGVKIQNADRIFLPWTFLFFEKKKLPA
jgi:hypothetical protein